VRLIANYNLISDLPSTGVYAPLGFGAYYRLMDRLGTVELGFGLRPVTPDDVAHDRALLDFLNVCYVLSREPLAGFSEVAQLEGVRIYRNERAAPRAFVVDQVEEVASVDAALAWVKSHPERLLDTAAVDTGLDARPNPGAAHGASARVVDYQPMSVRTEVTAPGVVVLVLTDTYYPGWQAQLDGVATPLHRSHGAFRAVVVPAGTHRVDFRYEPGTFWQGVAIAGVAAVPYFAWELAAGLRRTRVETRTQKMDILIEPEPNPRRSPHATRRNADLAELVE
jgi:hypothetical protein